MKVGAITKQVGAEIVKVGAITEQVGAEITKVRAIISQVRSDTSKFSAFATIRHASPKQKAPLKEPSSDSDVRPLDFARFIQSRSPDFNLAISNQSNK